MSSNQATVYVKSGCPWCIDALTFLKKSNVVVDVVDVLQDRDAFAKMKKISGQALTPTWEYEDEVIADFDISEFQEALMENPKSQALFTK